MAMGREEGKGSLKILSNDWIIEIPAYGSKAVRPRIRRTFEEHWCP